MSLSRASWAMRVSSNNQRSTNTACWSVLDDRLSVRVPRRTRSRASRPDRNRTLSSDTSRTAVHVTLTAARRPLRMIFGRITSCSGSSALFVGPRSACRPSGGYLQSLIVTRKGRMWPRRWGWRPPWSPTSTCCTPSWSGGATTPSRTRRPTGGCAPAAADARRHVRRPRRRHRRSPGDRPARSGHWLGRALEAPRPRNPIAYAHVSPCSPGKDRWRPPAASRTASRGPPRTR